MEPLKEKWVEGVKFFTHLTSNFGLQFKKVTKSLFSEHLFPDFETHYDIFNQNNSENRVFSIGYSSKLFSEMEGEDLKKLDLGFPKDEHGKGVIVKEEPPNGQENPKFPKKQNGIKNDKVKVESLYVADAHRLVPNLYTFGYDFKNVNEYWAVLNTGELYLGLPHGDSQKFNYEKEKTQYPFRFIPYKADGNTISGFEYNGREMSFQLGQDQVTVDSCTTFNRVDSCDNERFDGTFRHEAYSDALERVSSRGFPGQTTLTFTKDGKFSVKGCISDSCLLPRPHSMELRNKVFFEGRSIIRQPDSDVPYNHFKESNGKGLYSISENRIRLMYDDGRVEDSFFFVYPGNEGHILSINGVNYFKDEQ